MTVRIVGRWEANDAAVVGMFLAGGTAWLEMRRFLLRVSAKARLYAPVRTGLLRASIKTSMDSGALRTVKGTVYTTVDYGLWVHEGTRPHIIRARPGGVLAFDVGGRKVYTREVRHPGTRPRPFLRRALEEETRLLS